MQADYWLKRWQEGRTGWHHEDVMPLLVQHWPALKVPRGTRVLVPLCGKTRDMAWLAEQGLRVRGVELSPLAIEQFFAEHGLQPQRRETADGVCHTAGDIEIIEGDLFKVGDATLAECGAVYDRAAIIAQPAPERQRYAGEIYARLPTGCRGLVITLDFPQEELEGPPFSVPADEMQQLFGSQWDVETAERRDILAREPRFQEDGVTALHTAVYRLLRH